MANYDPLVRAIGKMYPTFTPQQCQALAVEIAKILQLVASGAYDPMHIQLTPRGGRKLPPLAEALRTLRERRGLTQDQVAGESGWSISKVTRMEAGDVAVSLTDLKHLLHLYGVSDPAIVNRLLPYARGWRPRR